MSVYANAGLDLLLAAGTEGAARKGHFRVRAFGGVFTFAVQCNRSGLGLCLGRTKLVAWHAVVAHVFAAVPLAQPMQLDR